MANDENPLNFGKLDFGGERWLAPNLSFVILKGEAPTRKSGMLAPPSTSLKKIYPVPAEIDEMIVTLYDTECRRDKNLNAGKDNVVQADSIGLIIDQ